MVRVTGGEAPGGSSLAPKIGPLGLVSLSSHSIPIHLFFLLKISLQKRSVMILLKQQVTGKACELQ